LGGKRGKRGRIQIAGCATGKSTVSRQNKEWKIETQQNTEEDGERIGTTTMR